jgi:hypothetical protein
MQNAEDLMSLKLNYWIIMVLILMYTFTEWIMTYCNFLGEKLSYLSVTMQNAEDLMSLKLDTSRNELLTANTTLTIATVAIG